jgi:hypothetical protein
MSRLTPVCITITVDQSKEMMMLCATQGLARFGRDGRFGQRSHQKGPRSFQVTTDNVLPFL